MELISMQQHIQGTNKYATTCCCIQGANKYATTYTRN